MGSEFLQSELWLKIEKLSKNAKRKHIAVAYLGNGASDLIPLHGGDTLVIDMSLQAIKSGQTNPYEVGKYIQAGASVFSCANLHAKVYIFDKTVVVSSGNLSLHSQNTLVEAGVVTKEYNVLTSARGFIKSLQVEPITPEYLKLCKKLYNPPQFGGQRKPRHLNKPVVPTYSRLWISAVYYRDYSNQEERTIQEDSRKALTQLRDKRVYEIETLWWYDSHLARTAQEGDLILQVCDDMVYPPCRIIRMAKRKSPHSSTSRFYMFIEQPKTPTLLKWSQFKKMLNKAGMSHLTPGSRREIISEKAKQHLLGLWG